MNRREWLGTCGSLLAGAALSSRVHAASPAVELEDLRVISWKPPLYHGWPTLCRKKNGELLLAFSGGRETHVCPFGRVELMRSQDHGVNWRSPQGSILVTTFTSLAYEAVLAKAEAIQPGEPGAWDELRLREWQAVHHRLTPAQRNSELGTWMIRSTDGGVTWSARYPVPVNSPHGPISLHNGRLLYPGVELWKAARRVGVCESIDDGVTWNWISDIPTRSGDDHRQYHELHAVECSDGRVVCHIRNHNAPNKGETLQSESADGGKTWSTPHSIGVWGLPSHLLRLKDGRLLMSYGHRRAPLGNQVRLSEDHGQTWSPALVLSGDGASGDLGYPSTVECDDGTLVTVWYEKLKDSPLAQLRQARWRLRA
jgi:sialidase-1